MLKISATTLQKQKINSPPPHSGGAPLGGSQLLRYGNTEEDTLGFGVLFEVVKA